MLTNKEARLMRRYFMTYIRDVERRLEIGSADWEALKSQMLVKIQFMQHERLIHFLVTCLFAILLFICLAILFISDSGGLSFLYLSALIVILLIPYIFHYYFLENKVQYLYKLYDLVDEKSRLERLKSI
jgi:fatty acid desaturase